MNNVVRIHCPSVLIGVLLGGVLGIAACGNHARTGTDARTTAARGNREPPADSAFPGVPDSAWVELTGPAIIAFHPLASNEELEVDEGLASTLDDFAYYLGTGMDSLAATGIVVSYHAGDTVWLRAGHRGSRFIRNPDSATVGYLFADTLGRRAVVYGVRTDDDLLGYAREFIRTGQIGSGLR